MPPAVTWIDDKEVFDWGENAASIVDGRNIRVYGVDAWYPAKPIAILGGAQMRKWHFIQIGFSPFEYNSAGKKLRLTRRAEIRIAFNRLQLSTASSAAALKDTFMDDIAAQTLANFAEAQQWYPQISSRQAAGETWNYVIITTNAIRNNSTKLADFKKHKEGRGVTVKIVTEDDYGALTGQAPNGTAEKIRQWLINNYIEKSIDYVLLIGDPNPDDPDDSNPDTDYVGEIPMKMMWPNRVLFNEYKDAPTDYYYADLTGNWNLDGDTYFGEYGSPILLGIGGDQGLKGIDIWPEVYVGRIPETDIDNIDRILEKIIIYQTSNDIAWRKSALLPMSFSDEKTDGGFLAEAMINDYLKNKGYSYYSMYQQGEGGTCTSKPNSKFDSNQTLRGGHSVQNKWKDNDYGLVSYWAHGLDQYAFVGYDGCNDPDGKYQSLLRDYSITWY